MKSLLKNSLILALVASFVALYSCKTEDPIVEFDAPTMTAAIKVNGTAATSPATVEVGDVVTGDFTILAPGNFNVLRITVSVDGAAGSTIELPRTNVTGVTDFTDFDITGLELLTVAAADEDKTIELTFEVVDDQDKTGTAPAISMDVAVGITSHTETLLGGQSNPTTGSFYNSVDNTVFTVSGAFDVTNQAKVDFVFWYGNTSMYAIGATDDENAVTAFNALTNPVNLANLATRNETRFKKLAAGSNTTFDAVSTQSALLALAGETGITETRVVSLVANDVFAFRLDSDRGSKIALAKVVSTAGDTPASRAITIEVKIQK